MSFNHAQDAVDEIVKKQLTLPGDDEQQPYEKETVRRFILEEMVSLREQGKTEVEIEGLVRDLETVFNMNKREFREYSIRLDNVNFQYIRDYNDDIVYREMIKMIIDTKGLVGIEALQTKKKLLELTPLKFKRSHPEIYFPLEKHILQAKDVKGKLKPQESIVSTVEKLRRIEEERNQLVGNNPQQLSLKPKK